MGVPGTSWGRWPRYRQRIARQHSRFDLLPDLGPDPGSLLPYGNGRSYGDVCLNDGGTLLWTQGLDRYIDFDETTGILECEAGVLLSDIMERFLPRGWFPAVSPGTGFVTVGGAIANDVHGKNHHRAGSFGHHVVGLELLRSDGQVLRCSPETHPDWFRATIGGLGLTGLIRTARLRLRRVEGPWIAGDSRRFTSLEEFLELEELSARDYEYTVAWLDCASGGRRLGRGVFMRGNHVGGPAPRRAGARGQRSLRLPLTPPFSPVRATTVRLFNSFYYHRAAASRARAVWHYQSFLHPLDGILEWNRMYGPRGFFQYQCVLPPAAALPGLEAMLTAIARSGLGSFLSVLKRFGPAPAAGLMSFARPGVTLALDFANRGAATLGLLAALDEITIEAGGAVYPAKDARMSAAAFQRYFPAWREFRDFIDPQFSSSFWRRVTEGAA
jgi:FAD/FMN-containing dehydrogenase